METDSFILLLTLIVSFAALVISIISSKTNYQEKEYERFLLFWIDMDSCFVEHPEIHKYFYDKEFNNKLPEENSMEFERAICIAEKFRDTFQYSERISRSIPKQYKASYYDYMNRIMNTAIYKAMDERNPIAYSVEHRIGSEYLKQG